MKPDHDHRRVIGIDIAQEKCDFHCLPDKICGVVNVQDYAEFAKQLVKMEPDLIIMEASGGYERPLLFHLAPENLPIAVVNPTQVWHFIGTKGNKAKTDRNDAKMLALFGLQGEVEAKPLTSQEQQELQDLQARRRQLVEMQTMETNRLHQAFSPRVKISLAAVIAALKDQIAEIDDEIDRRIKESPIWREKDELLQSIPGIGKATAHSLQAIFPELGSVTNQEIAAMAGLAPLAKESGKWKGARTIKGGRDEGRTALYMAAFSAMRWNPIIKTFYDRLMAKGKPYKVAITACMRKLLTIANSIIKHKKPFFIKTP
jgi:transposase